MTTRISYEEGYTKRRTRSMTIKEFQEALPFIDFWCQDHKDNVHTTFYRDCGLGVIRVRVTV